VHTEGGSSPLLYSSVCHVSPMFYLSPGWHA